MRLNNNDDASKGSGLVQLRSRRLLFKLNEWLFAKNRQMKLNLGQELSAQEIELIENSYVQVRLGQNQRGCIEKFSLLFASDAVKDEASLAAKKTSQQRILCELINQHRAKVLQDNGIDLKRATKSDKEQHKVSLNKLIRSKYNKHELLQDESAFLRFHEKLRAAESGPAYQAPIGFVVSSGFTLSNGKYSATGFVLGKHLLAQIKTKFASPPPAQERSSRLFYRAPNCLHMNCALIEQLIF